MKLGLPIVLAVAVTSAVPQQPTFRTSTHYVTLDVLVTDSDDRPVTDLTKDDFRIVERGKVQAISDFAHVSVPVGNAPIDLAAPVNAASDIASNGAAAVDSRAIAIVVDDTVLDTGDIVYIKRVLTQMVATLSPGDQVAFTYVRRSDLGHDFTNDAAQLVRSINQLTNAMGLPAVSRTHPVRDLLVTLESVTKTLTTAKQARRFIVLIGTRGCNPRGPSIINSLCQGTIDRARQSGTPIYAIDPTGELAVLIEDPLAILAIATGGVRYRQAEPWLSPARVMGDNGSYYLLSYYPDPLRDDGKFQNVEVTVTRPGLQVRSRRGYMAPSSSTTALTPHREMTAALGGGLPNPGIPIRAFVAPIAPGPRDQTKTLVTIEVGYPVPDGGFAGAFEDEWRVGILALDPDGRIKASFQRPYTFTGVWKPTARGTFLINETIDVPTQPLTFRVGVSSKALEKTGSVHIKVDVPDFRADNVSASPLILGTAVVDESDAASGLDRIRGHVPFQPTTERDFDRQATLRVYGRVAWRGSDKVDAELAVVGTGVAIPLSMEGGAESVTSDRHDAVIDKELPLVTLQPGRYVLRLTVTTQSDGKPIVREVPIVIR